MSSLNQSRGGYEDSRNEGPGYAAENNIIHEKALIGAALREGGQNIPCAVPASNYSLQVGLAMLRLEVDQQAQ